MPPSSTLKMEGARSSETLVSNDRTPQHSNPENHELNITLSYFVKHPCYSDSACVCVCVCRYVLRTRVYPKVSGLAAWSENCNWYSSLSLGAVVSLFCESFW
jgi:hypothetical protein